MKRLFKYTLALLSIGFCLGIYACTDDVGPLSRCNNCDADFPYSTDGSSTCYEAQASCESAEGTDCFICL